MFGRLYLESLDIGNMLQIVFGRENSENYSQLLSQFAIILRDLISAQLEGNTDEVNQNINRLYEDVDQRAAFLEAINPYWSEAEYKNLFGTYIQYIVDEANALATGDYARDIEIYDRLNAHTNIMGDVFAEGLYNYITSGSPPVRAGEQCITYEEMNEIFGIRMFWFELVTWIRNYMFSRYLNLGSTEAVYQRLLQVPVDYINVLKQIFGDTVTEDYIQLFYTYIELIDAFITAQIEGNIDENRITQLLYKNADERAAFIASLNPYWDETEWRNRLYNNLRSTIDESTSFLAGNYARNIDIFSTLLDQAESTGNYFAEGLFNYLNAV
jgi:hypothetical protein